MLYKRKECRKMEKLTFKNKNHEINYRIHMSFIPAHLQGNAEIQAVIYVIALIETENAGTAEDIFGFVTKSLSYGFFDHPDDDEVAKALALRIWETIYWAFDSDWVIYFFVAAKLNLWTILNFDKWNYFDYLLREFKIKSNSKNG